MYILVVDDDDQQRNLLKIGLEQKGYNVKLACNGMDCIEYTKLDTFDLIIMDYMMPIIDGLSALRMLKSNPKTKEIPVIMMSAENISTYGCSFLRKPFTISYLVNIIEELIKINHQKKILFS